MWPLSYKTERVGMIARATSSDKGAVAAIEENTGTMVRRRPGHRSSVKPLVASSTFSARTIPRGVSTRQPAPSRDKESAGVSPWTAAAAEVGAEIGLDLIGIVLQPRIDLPAIIARCAPARLLRFQYDRVHTLLGQMQCRGQPGEAAADDRDRDALVRIERRRWCRRHGRIGIQAWRQRLMGRRIHDGKLRVDAARAAKSPAYAHAAAG